MLIHESEITFSECEKCKYCYRMNRFLYLCMNKDVNRLADMIPETKKRLTDIPVYFARIIDGLCGVDKKYFKEKENVN